MSWYHDLADFAWNPVEVSGLWTRTHKEMEPCPSGYGLAYRPVNRDLYVYMPIPFNLLFRLALKIHGWLVVPFYPNLVEKIRNEEYERGRVSGHKYGKRIGYGEGFEAGRKAGRDEDLAEIQKIRCELGKVEAMVYGGGKRNS